MTVKELIKELEKFDLNSKLPVIVWNWDGGLKTITHIDKSYGGILLE
jgi:hypothetical protein